MSADKPPGEKERYILKAAPAPHVEERSAVKIEEGGFPVLFQYNCTYCHHGFYWTKTPEWCPRCARFYAPPPPQENDLQPHQTPQERSEGAAPAAGPVTEDGRLKALRDVREGVYGDAAGNHENTGLLWTAILQYHYRQKLPHPIPAHIMCLMVAAMKIERAAAPFKYHQDNHDDAINYIRMAAECDPRSKPKEVSDASSSNRS